MAQEEHAVCAAMQHVILFPLPVTHKAAVEFNISCTVHDSGYIPPPSAIDLIELRRLPLSTFYCTKQKYILLFIFLRAVKRRYRAGAMLHR